MTVNIINIIIRPSSLYGYDRCKDKDLWISIQIWVDQKWSEVQVQVKNRPQISRCKRELSDGEGGRQGERGWPKNTITTKEKISLFPKDLYSCRIEKHQEMHSFQSTKSMVDTYSSITNSWTTLGLTVMSYPRN